MVGSVVSGCLSDRMLKVTMPLNEMHISLVLINKIVYCDSKMESFNLNSMCLITSIAGSRPQVCGGRWGRGTQVYGLYRDVPLKRVWLPLQD